MTTKIIEQYINHNGSWVPYEPMIKRNGIFESPENLWVKYNGEYINNTWAVDSSTLNIEVQPIYSVTVTSNAKNSKVEFIASDKVRRVENTGDNTSVTFTEIPAGEYSITISEETHQTLNSSGVINEPIDLKYSLSKVPKLVQIDSDYESYLLDTAYNYVDIMDNSESVATIDLKSISSISIIDNTVKYSNNELAIKGTLSLHYYD